MSRPVRVSPALVAGAAVGSAIVGVLAALSLTGIGIRRPVSHPDPAHSVDDAWQRVEMLRAAEENAIHPAGHTTLLAPTDPEPGTPTVVLMHGLTMTPNQFGWIGDVIRDAGYRVLLPRMPDHGRTDGSSDALLVLNNGDDAVSDRLARELFRSCFFETAGEYEEITLPSSLGWSHDFIDPWLNPRPNPQAVLEVLLGSLGIEEPGASQAIEAYRP